MIRDLGKIIVSSLTIGDRFECDRTKTMIVSRYLTIHLLSPLTIGRIVLTEFDDLDILLATFDSQIE